MRVLALARIAFVGTAAMAAFCPAARADFNEDQKICSQDGVAPDVRIAVCTRQIESGKLEGANLGVPYNSRGFAYREKGDPDHAIADFSQAIQLDPKYVFAWNNRGNAYFDKKDYDRAIADFNQTLELDPKYVLAYYGRGTAWRMKKDYDRAVADYTRAIDFNPKYAYAYNDRGVAYTNKNDVDRAIADYSQAIQIDPKYVMAYTNRALMYQNKADFDHAIADFTQVIALAPSLAAYYNRGVAYKDKRDYDRAIADYSRAIEINPKALDPYNARAIAYRYKGDFAAAMADYTRELQIDPKILAAIFSRGHLAVLTGGAQPAAMADLKQAAEMLPKNAYPALWIEIANKRSKANSTLAEAAKQLDTANWPAPVTRLFLGQSSPEDVLAAASSGNAPVRLNQTCSANFYIGEYYLWQGKKDDAKRLFALAGDAACQSSLLEYESAKAELKALEAKL